MSYEPTPGTIPFRAYMWLRSMAKIAPSVEPSTAEMCEGLGIEHTSLTAYMRLAREHGLVHTRKATGSKILHWRIGDGTPDPALEMHFRQFPEASEADDLTTRIKTSLFPPPVPGFRAIEWDGHLLATGMEIRDGVAIFKPEHIAQLKRHTDWWRAP